MLQNVIAIENSNIVFHTETGMTSLESNSKCPCGAKVCVGCQNWSVTQKGLFKDLFSLLQEKVRVLSRPVTHRTLTVFVCVDYNAFRPWPELADRSWKAWGVRNVRAHAHKPPVLHEKRLVRANNAPQRVFTLTNIKNSSTFFTALQLSDSHSKDWQLL